MTDLHLVLHKVRGEATFDVAQPVKIGNEDGWIVPTSGHRCYPWMIWPLSQLGIKPFDRALPPDWPDHYQVARVRETPKKPGTTSPAHDISLLFGS